MRGATRDAKSSTGRARATTFFPAFGVKGSYGQSLFFSLSHLASCVATNAKRKLSRCQPVGHLTGIPAHGHLHLAVKFSQEGRAQLRVVIKKLQRRSHPESRGIQ